MFHDNFHFSSCQFVDREIFETQFLCAIDVENREVRPLNRIEDVILPDSIRNIDRERRLSLTSRFVRCHRLLIFIRKIRVWQPIPDGVVTLQQCGVLSECLNGWSGCDGWFLRSDAGVVLRVRLEFVCCGSRVCALFFC